MADEEKPVENMEGKVIRMTKPVSGPGPESPAERLECPGYCRTLTVVPKAAAVAKKLTIEF